MTDNNNNELYFIEDIILHKGGHSIVFRDSLGRYWAPMVSVGSASNEGTMVLNQVQVE